MSSFWLSRIGRGNLIDNVKIANLIQYGTTGFILFTAAFLLSPIVKNFILGVFANAIKNGDARRVSWLISARLVDIDNANLPDTNVGRTPLMLAVWHGQLEIAEILLRANANIDAVDRWRRTACHVATSIFSEDALILLLKYKPNLNLKDRFGTKIVDIGYGWSKPALLKLIKAGAPLDNNSILLATATNVEILEALMERGVVVRGLRDNQNQTALHYAAGSHDVDLLNRLVNVCDGDLETVNGSGFTCTHIAACCNNVVAVRVFIQAGADVNRTTRLGQTPLFLAQNYDCTVLLLAAGAAADSLSISRRVGNVAMIAASIIGTDEKYEMQNIGTHNHREIAKARHDIAKTRLDFVRQRALQVCIGLQSLDLPAFQTCEILQFACGPIASLVQFHQWWAIATAVKHYCKEE